ncbi:hypothetical protein HMPREF0973_01646 [Prevotella veroralis F0319]|uniref:Uncharacterized protein n=1 Tax=Prevotella veroralis F0319 TaxID=649761 RepID=C9MPV0_9BACT|nr:hypothetical protein HMPREF0973_01646 [Prevotella veroralis F0319]
MKVIIIFELRKGLGCLLLWIPMFRKELCVPRLLCHPCILCQK